MKRSLLLAAVLLAAPLTLMFAGPAHAQEAPVVMRVTGTEFIGPDGAGPCDPTNMILLCFEIDEGDPDTAFIAGETVTVELTAGGEAPHNLFVTLEENADALDLPDGTTSNDALGTSDTADAGQTVQLTFTVPETGTLYFWCDVGPDNHEALGMQFTAAINEPPEADNNTTVPPFDPDNLTMPDNGPAANNTAGNGTDDDSTTSGLAGNNTTADGHGDEGAEVDESPVPFVAVMAAIGVALVGARRRYGA